MNTLKLLTATILLLAVTDSSVQAQPYPGGVSGNISLWLKANASTGNLTYNGSNQVSAWKDELSTYTLTQTVASKRPVLTTVPNAITDFNFNPSLQFDVATTRALANTGATPDLLGTSGTAFVVVNTYQPIGISSSSCFAYMSSSSFRYQMKANFRIQTGNNGTGYTADINLGPATIYPDLAGRVLVSRSTGPTFNSRRNAEVFNINNTAALYNPAVGTGLCIGSNSNSGGSEYSSSAIAEVITYNTTLSLADINKVESYLAIKYGATLDQSVATDYVASNSTVTWSATANTGFANNITGIGRDDNAGLLQKQSKSVNYNGHIYLYNGNAAGVFPDMNVSNTTTISADNNFLILGDNAGDTSLNACYNNGHRQRMSRTWKVQKTGSAIGAVTLAYNTGVFNGDLQYLLVSQNAAFPAGATVVYPLSAAASKKYVSITLSNNDYFTFATDSLVLALADTIACPGSGVKLTPLISGSTSPGTFAWDVLPGGSPISSLSCTSCASPVASPTVNTSYTVVYHYGSCNVNGASLVTVLNGMDLFNGDTAICQGQSVQVNAAGDATYQYSWSPGNGVSNTGILSPLITPNTTQTYSLTASYPGCKDSSLSFTIDVQEYPVVFAGNDTTMCLASSFMLNGSVTPASQSYTLEWSPATLVNNPYVLNPVYTSNTGSTLSLTATTSAGCSSSDDVTLNISQTHFLQISDDTTISYGTQAMLNASGAALYQWMPASYLSSSTINNPICSALAPVTYTLLGVNEYGCIDTAFVTVNIDYTADEYLPTAFTPNGDGRNDVFRILYTSNQKIVEFRIFNRWGKEVFATTDITKGWDGSYNGTPQEAGSYYYHLKLGKPDGSQKTYNGDVTLIR